MKLTEEQLEEEKAELALRSKAQDEEYRRHYRAQQKAAEDRHWLRCMRSSLVSTAIRWKVSTMICVTSMTGKV